VSRAVAALSLALIAHAGCAEPEARFPVVITALTDDGKPVAELAVTLGHAAAGRTDGAGKLALRVVGKEGQRVVVTVAVPAGWRLASPLEPLVLRKLAELEGGAQRPLPIEYGVKLAPLVREYAVLVRAGVAGLPVEAFGARQAVTNSRGVAMFLYRGAPGDELQVKLSTVDHPELRPQNPTASFLLAARSEAYVVKEHFAMVKPLPPPRRRPVHLGPKRL
jgi:hypothetical protein